MSSSTKLLRHTPRSNAFPIDAAQIVALFMECIFYGMYLVTFVQCMRALLIDKETRTMRRLRHINKGMTIVATAMFVLGTLDVAFGLRHNLDAFIYWKGAGGAKEEFGIISYWVNVMKFANYVAQTAIGDGVLIYRCFMVYNRNWWVTIFPILLWAGGLATGGGILWVEITTDSSALLNESRLTPWIKSLLILTMAVNVLVTSLIVWRIWRVKKQTGRSSAGDTGLGKVIRIILDSGLLYTSSTIILFATTLAESNAQYGLSDSVLQIIGITFNLIIIRVHDAPTHTSGGYYLSGPVGSRGTGNGPFPVRFRDSVITTRKFIPPLESPVRHGIAVSVEVSHITDSESIRGDKTYIPDV